MLDYLAEVTMSILQKQKERDPSLGYARDFVGAMESVFPASPQRGMRVVANAGGVNPAACAAAVRHGRTHGGCLGKRTHRRGDGRRPPPAPGRAARPGPRAGQHGIGRAALHVRDRVLSANAYLGVRRRSSKRSRSGANVVITGRSTDTALTMAPLLHEFGWRMDDWDKLAAGIVAGHIIECGAQCSGGNCLYDWRTIPDLANVGYPIVEATRRRHRS